MGIQSRLGKRNNTSLIYDRDKMPDGLDTEIWHLTLVFEQLAEYYGHSVARPIVYTELSNRISRSGVRSKSVFWSHDIESMMSIFWGYELDPDRSRYAVNDFCNADTFSRLAKTVLTGRKRQNLKDAGLRKIQPDLPVRTSRRSSADSLASEIINKRYTQEELSEILGKFRGSQSISEKN